MNSTESSLLEETDLERRAHEMCRHAHAGQMRAEGIPYHTHPEAVVAILRKFGVRDPQTLAAGYLHDVLEDTDVSRETLCREFGTTVVELVDELTNKDYPGRTFEQKHRALAEHARKMSDPAKMIKMADRYHNLDTMKVWDEAKRTAYARVTVDLLAALEPYPLPTLAEKIRGQVDHYLNGTSS